MGKLTGKVVWITGASSGLGAAMATEMARRGAKLVLFARRADRLEALAKECVAAGGEAVAVVGDVTSEADLARAVTTARERFGRLDIAVANAGFGVVGPFPQLSLDDYRRQFDTNVFAVLATVKAALPEVEKVHGGIVLVGSVAGFVAVPGGTAYSMSKFAVRALAESLYLELQPRGVAVTHIAPGFVETEIRMVDNRGHNTGRESAPRPWWIRVTAAAAARSIVGAIASRRRERVITNHGKAIVAFSRYCRACWFFLLRQVPVRTRPEPTA